MPVEHLLTYIFGVDSTLEKEEGFQFQTSQGMNGKTRVPREKIH